MNFAENLKKMRLMRGMSQRALAESADVETNTVYKWEKGQASPSVESLYRIAEALGVEPSALLDDGAASEEFFAPAPTQRTPRTHDRYERGSVIIECERGGGKATLKVVVPPGMNEQMLDRILKKIDVYQTAGLTIDKADAD